MQNIIICLLTRTHITACLFFGSAMFTWTNLLVVVVELDGQENEALDLVPLVTNIVLEEHYLIVGVVVVVDPGVIPINSRGEKQRMHLRDGFLADQLDPIYVAYNMWWGGGREKGRGTSGWWWGGGGYSVQNGRQCKAGRGESGVRERPMAVRLLCHVERLTYSDQRWRGLRQYWPSPSRNQRWLWMCAGFQSSKVHKKGCESCCAVREMVIGAGGKCLERWQLAYGVWRSQPSRDSWKGASYRRWTCFQPSLRREKWCQRSNSDSLWSWLISWVADAGVGWGECERRKLELWTAGSWNCQSGVHQ